MKKVIVFMFLVLFAVNVGAEVKQEVDSFDGSVENSSETFIVKTYQNGSIYRIYMFNTGTTIGLMLSIFSDKIYAFRSTDMELKINNIDIIKVMYVMQQPRYISYYPTDVLNSAAFHITDEVKDRILSASSISFRAYTDVGDIVYDVPESMLSEWKYVLSAPLIAGYQSMYKNITWAMRGSDNYYCVDICDENWNVYEGLRAVQCSMSRSWSPKNYINRVLGVQDGIIKGFKFNWRVWSPSGYGGDGYEGTVTCE